MESPMVYINDLRWVIGEFLFFISLMVLALVELFDRWNHKRPFWAFVLVIIGLLAPVYREGKDLLWPIVRSGKIELSTEDFIPLPDLKQYKLELPQQIEDVDVLFSDGVDQNGNYWRISWVKHVDFRIIENYIQTNHEFNNAMGKHVLIYEYRTFFTNYPIVTRATKKSLTE